LDGGGRAGIIKFMSWEESFVGRIGDVRDQELALFRRAAIIMSLFQTLMQATPIVVCVLTLGLYALLVSSINGGHARTNAHTRSLIRSLTLSLSLSPPVSLSLSHTQTHTHTQREREKKGRRGGCVARIACEVFTMC
jgi:hypothetical protein